MGACASLCRYADRQGPVPTTNPAGAEAHPGYAYATGGFEGLGGCSAYGDGRQASSACSGLRGASRSRDLCSLWFGRCPAGKGYPWASPCRTCGWERDLPSVVHSALVFVRLDPTYL